MDNCNVCTATCVTTGMLDAHTSSTNVGSMSPQQCTIVQSTCKCKCAQACALGVSSDTAGIHPLGIHVLLLICLLRKQQILLCCNRM